MCVGLKSHKCVGEDRHININLYFLAQTGKSNLPWLTYYISIFFIDFLSTLRNLLNLNAHSNRLLKWEVIKKWKPCRRVFKARVDINSHVPLFYYLLISCEIKLMSGNELQKQHFLKDNGKTYIYWPYKKFWWMYIYVLKYAEIDMVGKVEN